jgi:nitroreductase
VTAKAEPGGHPVLDLTIDELLTTTRAVRRRLDLDRPVPRAVVEECLRIGFQAPTGQNTQDWGWVLVDDPDTRRALADQYRQGLADHAARDRTGEVTVAGTTPGAERISRSVAHLVEHLHRVPVLLVPTIAQRYGYRSAFAAASTWGSILPAVWNVMLALRSRGLGSAWTTLHVYREREVADLLGIPDGQLQVGLFPIAYTIGTDFRPADRRASEDRIFWNRWRDTDTDTDTDTRAG